MSHIYNRCSKVIPPGVLLDQYDMLHMTVISKTSLYSVSTLRFDCHVMSVQSELVVVLTATGNTRVDAGSYRGSELKLVNIDYWPNKVRGRSHTSKFITR